MGALTLEAFNRGIANLIEDAVREEIERSEKEIKARLRERIGGLMVETAKLYSIEYHGTDIRITIRDARDRA